MPKRPTQAELKARPHKCEHEDQTYRFDSHSHLALHLMRQHFVRLSMVSKCYSDCEMLDAGTVAPSAPTVLQ